MMGLSIKDLKKHPSLVPLFACFGVGALGAALYVLRLATRNPDVSWNPKKNSEPWQEYSNKQYKFYSTEDYSKFYKEPPKF
ncbi:cytochrome c oxidase subunit NDUFA4 [Venturia canescens]|uniref:cytochrome c oxidase subunit NDUFA4 n=1 Tax=Venturia canescens TaxID=32260 RepID=UPI001C9C181F|nr:cytochrome c oxidase subunit NDUFA4 [Venturia canescens]